MVLSDYEKKRLENIERNNELLRQLNIPKLDVPRRSSPAKKHTPKKVQKEKQAPTRVSARLRGIAASEVPDQGDLKRSRSPDGDDSEAKRSKRIDRLDEDQQKEFMDVLKSIRKAPNTEPVARKLEKKDMDAESALRRHASQLQIRHPWTTVKVTTDRINGIVFHPSNTKLLAIAGDTSGNLGFWDVNGSKKGEDNDEEEEPVVYMYRPHTRAITTLMFNPVDDQRLYTSSYDGTIQYFDIAQGSFESISLGSEKYPITHFDWALDGKSLWFCTSDGEVAQHDIRSRRTPKIHSLRDKKIGSISLNPVHEHLIAVASNDRTATIWDNRMLDKEPLHELTHEYSVTSAYWSPRGDKLVTTAYDDYIRIFELADSGEVSLQSAIPHNTHTGRWVTNLRARWNENTVSHVVNGKDHQHFAIGSMKHPVHIISGETGNTVTELYDPDHITAVPAVAQFHPRTESMTILCGNASGRMVCWS